MSEVTSAPDIRGLEVPTDAWTQPFWDAAAQGHLRFPRCAECGRFRWPPGPFCPACQSQAVQWVAPPGVAHGRESCRGSPGELARRGGHRRTSTGRPRWRRIFAIAGGWAMVASRRSRPPQPGQVSTSMANVRRSKSAHA